MQRLGPPDVEARSVGRDGWSALNIATMHYGWDLKRRATASSSTRFITALPISSKDLNDIDLDFVELTPVRANMKRWNLDKTRTILYAMASILRSRLQYQL